MSSEIQTASALSNLQNMGKFYLTYCDRLPEKCQMPSGKLVTTQITQTPSGQFTKAAANIFASPYQLYLPTKEELRQKLLDWTEEQEGQQI
jgi:hypothetical protein